MIKNELVARNTILLALAHGEQTEAHLFADAEQRGVVAAHDLNAAIAALIADGRVVETTIHGVDALRMAA